MSISPDNVVVGLGIFLAIWYLLASIFNRRRGITIYHWLRPGLDSVGSEVSGRWIGSSGSGAQIHVHQANPPFKEVEIVFLLASRELLPLFLIDLVRRKTDRLIVKLTLRANPGLEIEIARAGSNKSRRIRSDQDRPWQIQETSSGLVIGARKPVADASLAGLQPFLEKYSASVQEISWSKKPPHVIVILSLAALAEKVGDAAHLFEDLAGAVTSAGAAGANGTTT